jgi:Phage integrase family
VNLHDLRHTVVSLLLELGTPPHVVQAIVRHADLDVTMGIYAHTNLDPMREALDKIDWDAEWEAVATRLLHRGVTMAGRATRPVSIVPGQR